jgi:hypothetical protein
MNTWKKAGLLLLFIPAMPLVVLLYVIKPDTKVNNYVSMCIYY